jgi:hypothetical protein
MMLGLVFVLIWWAFWATVIVAVVWKVLFVL